MAETFRTGSFISGAVEFVFTTTTGTQAFTEPFISSSFISGSVEFMALFSAGPQAFPSNDLTGSLVVNSGGSPSTSQYLMRARRISNGAFVYWKVADSPDFSGFQAPVVQSDLTQIVLADRIT